MLFRVEVRVAKKDNEDKDDDIVQQDEKVWEHLKNSELKIIDNLNYKNYRVMKDHVY